MGEMRWGVFIRAKRVHRRSATLGQLSLQTVCVKQRRAAVCDYTITRLLLLLNIDIDAMYVVAGHQVCTLQHYTCMYMYVHV